MTHQIDPLTARKTFRTLEPIHGIVYFAPETSECYGALGLAHHRSGYFASRSAALGVVPPEVVVATFFNFEPGLVRRSLDGVWAQTTPTAVLDARLEVVDRALHRLLGDGVGSREMTEAAGLARRAAERASELVHGRPLFAAHASLPWPDEPHLVLWHAQTRLREYRGDGHIAALVTAGLDGIEALVSHAASGDVPADVLRTSRAWDGASWEGAIDELRGRGILTADPDPTFTPEGTEQRRRIEERTDRGAAPAYDVLGEDGCHRLRELVRPMSRIAASEIVLPRDLG